MGYRGKKEGWGAGHWDGEQVRATGIMTGRWSQRKNRDQEQDREMEKEN